MNHKTTAFIDYLGNEKKFATSTIQGYKSFIKEFDPFLEKYKHDATLVVRKYIMWLQNCTNNKETTVNNKLSYIKSYFYFLYREGFIDVTYQRRTHFLKYWIYRS